MKRAAGYRQTPVDKTKKESPPLVKWINTWFHKVSVLFSIVSVHSYKSKHIRQ